MVTFLKKLSKTKEDLVIVGSWASFINGKTLTYPNDIDIRVTSLEGLEVFGEIVSFTSTSPLSHGMLRSKIDLGVNLLDIWIGNTLPCFEVVNGVRVETLEHQIGFYENFVTSTNDDFFKEKILKKLNVLKS